MSSKPFVSEVRYFRADENLRATGLLGWASILLDGRFRVEGIGIRRTSRRQLSLSFPYRDDGFGKRWFYLRPINDETRAAIEEQVLAQLALQEAVL